MLSALYIPSENLTRNKFNSCDTRLRLVLRTKYLLVYAFHELRWNSRYTCQCERAYKRTGYCARKSEVVIMGFQKDIGISPRYSVAENVMDRLDIE